MLLPGRAAPVLVALGLSAAVVPRPGAVVEHVYASGVYPSIQAVLTTASNALPVAVFDLVLIAAVAAALHTVRRAWQAWRRDGATAAAGLVVRRVGTGASVAYLWFLLVWGLNYSRPPIDLRLGLPPGRPSVAEVRRLLDEAVAQVNSGHAPAHAPRVRP